MNSLRQTIWEEGVYRLADRQIWADEVMDCAFSPNWLKKKKEMNEVGIWFEKTQVQDSATRGLTSLCKFKNQLYKKYIDRSSRVDNFTISRNF